MKKKFKLIEMVPLALSVCLLTGVVSCGSDDDDSSSSTPPPQQEEVQEGVYRAELKPENPDKSSASGSAELSVQGDTFTANIVVNNAGPAVHAQHVHPGARCPTVAQDDANDDGVVDAVEAGNVYEPPLLPLDNDLSSDGGTFSATYPYEESASFSQMLSNLNLQTLFLEGMVVNIHGLPDSVDIPDTAQGGRAGFPISCGVLVRVTDGSTGGTSGGTTGTGGTGGTTGTGGTGGTTGTGGTGGTTGTGGTGGTTGTGGTSGGTNGGTSGGTNGGTSGGTTGTTAGYP